MQDMRIKLPDDMHSALKELSEKQGRPMATIIRDAIGAHLKQLGYDVTTKVEWGGDRRSEE